MLLKKGAVLSEFRGVETVKIDTRQGLFFFGVLRFSPSPNGNLVTFLPILKNVITDFQCLDRE